MGFMDRLAGRFRETVDRGMPEQVQPSFAPPPTFAAPPEGIAQGGWGGVQEPVDNGRSYLNKGGAPAAMMSGGSMTPFAPPPSMASNMQQYSDPYEAAKQARLGGRGNEQMQAPAAASFAAPMMTNTAVAAPASTAAQTASAQRLQARRRGVQSQKPKATFGGGWGGVK